jgi:hypothetical protein
MTKTLRDLIDELEELAEEHGDDVEVRMAQQPNWPFEYSVDAVVAVVNVDEDEEGEVEPKAGEPIVVYLAEGRQLGYLSGFAVRALGWK